MFSARNKQYLVSAIASQKVADDVEKRLDLGAVASYEAEMEEIKQYLVAAFANAELGNILADKLEQAEACLVAQANGEIPETPAVAAQFDGQVAGMTTDVTIDANIAGASGNITLVADGSDIDALILDWNTTNFGNTVTLSAGDGSQVPTEDIVLTGGADLVPASNPSLVAAKAAFNSVALSEDFKNIILVALCDKEAADAFVAEHDAMVVAVAALS
jgi:hypothetical protein